MAKRDCIMYDKETKECTGLNKTYCIFEEECAFYKSKKRIQSRWVQIKRKQGEKR